ncbi:MAG: lamin tail domain-containing protein, partial [Bacteroidota bacterium]
YIQAGESGTNDSYDLYRQDGTTSVKIIDGTDAGAGSRIDARIRVLRTAAGSWELYSDPNKTDNYTLEGSTTDNTYTTTSWFGISLTHTSSRANSFFFDNIYVGPQVQDTLPASFLSVNPLSATELALSFSEALDVNSANNVGNYQLLPGPIAISSAMQDANNPAQVLLRLTSPLQSGNSYDMVVSDLLDLNGNQMPVPESLNFNFFVPEIPVANDVIFNEIFADPTPTQGLPEAEYLEIFNRSNKSFDIGGWRITNGSTIGSLPSHIMEPGDILILTEDSDTAMFTGLGTVISPNNWTTLVNSGDNLGLRSADGALLDSVDYLPSWFRDQFKAGGGFSLERINPNNLDCPPKANWAATINSRGGTPGTVNSIFDPNPENEPPTLADVTLIDPQRLELCFSESIDPDDLNTPGLFSLSGIGTAQIAEGQGPDFECVLLSFSSPLQQGQIYQLRVDASLKDCSGNALGRADSIPVVLARPAQPFEVVITELYPDPNPSQGLPDAEYVEIYNRSSEVLDVSGAVLSDGGSFGQINNLQIFPSEYVILCSFDDLDEFRQYGKVIGLSS